jgi:uncharacterized protein (DUF3820 family)
MTTLKDDSMMPFGQYRGRQMADVPAEYLFWLYDTGKCFGAVKAYIIDNLEAIKSQMKFSKNRIRQ